MENANLGMIFLVFDKAQILYCKTVAVSSHMLKIAFNYGRCIYINGDFSRIVSFVNLP